LSKPADLNAPARRALREARIEASFCSGSGSLSSGELLTHGAVVWLTNIITFGLLFWQPDRPCR